MGVSFLRLSLGVAVAALVGGLVSTLTPTGGRWYGLADGGVDLRSGPTEIPSGFLTRAYSGFATAEEQAWLRVNGGTESLNFSHHLAEIFPRELYASHPEFFPWVDGQRMQPAAGRRDYYWNPDIARADAARYAAEQARKFFAAQPTAGSFAVGFNDGLIWGESPELRALTEPLAWFREMPDYSRLVFTFTNRVATELARTHPDKYVGALAYYWAENPPPFPLHPRVVPFLTADRAQGYDAEFWREELGNQVGWARVAGRGEASAAEGRRLGIYDYLDGVGFVVPRIWPQLLARHIEHAHRVGFTDYFGEASPNWGLDGPMMWLSTQLTQGRGPVERLLEEYYAGYYQEAAAPMRRFFERCEAQWMAQPGRPYWLKHYRNESQAGVYPAAVRQELRALLTEAERQAQNLHVRKRVRLVSEAFGLSERFVDWQEAKAALTSAVLRGNADERDTLLVRYVAARREFLRYEASLRRAQPLAVKPFELSDYTINDPVPAALLARAARLPVPLPAELAEEWGVLWRALVAMRGPGEALLRNPGMAGEVRPARMIAGLPYGLALPAEWNSSVEPRQYHRAEWRDFGVERGLRITGTENASLWQWVQVEGGGVYRARVQVRGRVEPSTRVGVVLTWVGGDNRILKIQRLHLPEGEWPEWVTLEQAGLPPPGAAWVGVGMRVDHQTQPDWVEVKGFDLRRWRAE